MQADKSSDNSPSKLNLFHGTALVIGSMFGIGIFLYPPLVAKYTGSFSLFLLVWLLGGLISLCGAFAYSELGVLFPKAGGDYTFHKEILGDATGFASGWLLFLGIFSGSIATMTSAIIYFQLSSLLGIDFSSVLLSYPWGGVLTSSEVAACGIILFFTFSNMISIRFSGNLQIVLTVIPVTLVLALCLYGVFMHKGFAHHEVSTLPPENQFDFIKAYLLVYFAYAGWNAVVYFSGDFRNPKKDVPFSLLMGTGATTLFYFVLGAAFVSILGFYGLQQVPEAGTAIAGIIGGQKAETIMTGLIALAILASINGTVLAGGKIGYAMAKDGTLGIKLDEEHQPVKWQNLLFILQGVWSIFLILTGSFEALTELTSLAMLVTAGLSMISLFLLRKKMHTQELLFQFRGFMLAPWVFLIVNIAVLGVSIHNAILNTQEGAESGIKAWYSLIGLIIFVFLWLGHKAISSLKTNRTKIRPLY